MPTLDDKFDELEQKLKPIYGDLGGLHTDGLVHDMVSAEEHEARKTIAAILCSAYDLDAVLFDGQILENYEDVPYATGWCYADQKGRFPDGVRIYTSVVLTVKDESPEEPVHPRLLAFGNVKTRNSRYGVVPKIWSNLTGPENDRAANDPVSEVREAADAGAEVEGRSDDASSGADASRSAS